MTKWSICSHELDTVFDFAGADRFKYLTIKLGSVRLRKIYAKVASGLYVPMGPLNRLPTQKSTNEHAVVVLKLSRKKTLFR